MNCTGTGDPIFVGGVEAKQCPQKIITAQSRIYLQAYSFYIDGHLPDPKMGGPFDQGNKVMEAMALIKREVEKAMERK